MNTIIQTAVQTTLPTIEAQGLLKTREDRFAFKQEMKARANARALTAYDMAVHAILLGKPHPVPFTPVSNARKLANGHFKWQGALAAYTEARHTGLPDWAMQSLTGEARKALCDAIKEEAIAVTKLLWK